MLPSNVDLNPDAAELRKFGLIMGGLIGFCFGILIPWIWSFEQWPRIPWYIAAGFAVPAIVYPKSLGPVFRLWMKFALVIGWINTRLILGLVFYVIIFPIGRIMLLFNDPMRRKLDNSSDSYRVESKAPDADRMERPF